MAWWDILTYLLDWKLADNAAAERGTRVRDENCNYAANRCALQFLNDGDVIGPAYAAGLMQRQQPGKETGVHAVYVSSTLVWTSWQILSIADVAEYADEVTPHFAELSHGHAPRR